MKKKNIMLLVIMLLIFSSCSIKNINNYDVNEIIKEVLDSNIKVTNEVHSGYKYYLPRGCKLLDNNGYNSEILFKKDELYLFVDVVSYYHKASINYEEKDNLFFSKKISYNDYEGYIEIDKKDNNYYLEMVYNYSKIESFVSEANLKDAIYNAITILSSVTYNDNILSTLIGENQLNYKEEKFSLFDSQREEGNFLDYVEEYDIYEEDKKDKDEDFIIQSNE